MVPHSLEIPMGLWGEVEGLPLGEIGMASAHVLHLEVLVLVLDVVAFVLARIMGEQILVTIVGYL